MAGREAVRHADSDAGWRLGRRDSGLNVDPKTQTHRGAHLRVRVRVRVWRLVLGHNGDRAVEAVRVRVRVRTIFERRSGDRTRVDGS